MVFGTMALGSFSSGHILTTAGWDTVNDVVFPPVALALISLLFYRRWRNRQAQSA